MSIMLQKWHVKPNDLIGGWCVMPVDKTPAEAGIIEVADFCSKEAAMHIAFLHNEWLERCVEIRAG